MCDMVAREGFEPRLNRLTIQTINIKGVQGTL